MPAKATRTWVVVADGTRARFFCENDDQNGLVPAEPAEMSSANANGHARDLKSDRPGRSFSTSGTSRHALEPRHDYHKMEKRKFAIEVARHLDESCAAHAFDRLLLVAPKRSLGELRTLLSKPVRDRISGELAKDLTKFTIANVWENILPHIYPAAEPPRRLPGNSGRRKTD